MNRIYRKIIDQEIVVDMSQYRIYLLIHSIKGRTLQRKELIKDSVRCLLLIQLLFLYYYFILIKLWDSLFSYNMYFFVGQVKSISQFYYHYLYRKALIKYLKCDIKSDVRFWFMKIDIVCLGSLNLNNIHHTRFKTFFLFFFFFKRRVILFLPKFSAWFIFIWSRMSIHYS